MYRQKQEGNSVMSNRNLWVRRNKEEEIVPYVAKRKNGVRCEGTMKEILLN
jgi:hypothetical protein